MNFDITLLEHFERTGKTLHGLPGAAYTDDRFFHLELSRIFAREWVFAGFAHGMEKVGDVRPIEVGGFPLFLLRAEDGNIAAYHNVCRHRNTQLVGSDCNTGRQIRCPYHHWSYDLCGALKSAPYFGGRTRELPVDFRFEEYGLLPVHCQVWHDWIFVKLASSPLPFEDFLAPIKNQLGLTDVSEFEPVTTIDMGVVDCNWKSLMENYIEPYHVQFVHKDTTDQPLTGHYTVVDRHCLGSAFDSEESDVTRVREGTLGVTSHYLTLFPNFVLGTYQPDQLGVHINTPLSVSTTRQSRVIYIHRESQYSDNQIKQLEDLWYKVHLEDHEMCERMQLGRRSPVASTGGVLSPHWENSVRKFQELVVRSVAPALANTDKGGNP
ncbi:MAG: aromatic ring-hydroxylating dioxygenase subunit alpha [Acidiferrobacterales bacterium]|nr:aromatic ring-hydroxylating dioxygenase subunit alpha [Acidiferrobacterales bacterium]